jgi:hypothetical protein
MPTSPARISANRRNASKSCGPKTPEGKEITRRNALKHGLTGEGVALPTEDTVEIERRFEALANDLRPTTEAGRLLVKRYAFLSVRLDRCERHETMMLSKRVREAIDEYDDLRFTDVELLVSNLYIEPMTSSRRLQTTPEGIDWLVENWRELRGDLMIEDRLVWNQNHWARAELLMGDPKGNVRVTRPRALTEAVSGFFLNLEPTDGEGLDDQARALWAKGELAALIDAEIARLTEARESLDPEAMERDRLEAPDRALFDPSKEMVLARKYEGATERAMHKALKEFRQVEAEASADISNATQTTETVSETLASSGNEPESEDSTVEPGTLTPRQSLPASPRTVPFPILRVLEAGSKPVEFAEMALC